MKHAVVGKMGGEERETKQAIQLSELKWPVRGTGGTSVAFVEP